MAITLTETTVSAAGPGQNSLGQSESGPDEGTGEVRSLPSRSTG